MSSVETATPSTVIGAMRLGLEAAYSDRTALLLVKALLECAPPTRPSNTASTELLVNVVREYGHWSVAA